MVPLQILCIVHGSVPGNSYQIMVAFQIIQLLNYTTVLAIESVAAVRIPSVATRRQRRDGQHIVGEHGLKREETM